MGKKKGLEGNFYAVAKAILFEHIDMGQPSPPIPLPEHLDDPEYWRTMPAHPEYGNIYYPYHCHHEGILFTVKDCDGHVAGEHMRFPDARVLARKLNESKDLERENSHGE